MPSVEHPDRGALISIEGLNGVGKTYLTGRVVEMTARHERPPVVIEEFSRRTATNGRDLGRQLLRSLVTASHGERFLRAGFPRSETLLLLAIKMHDFETTVAALRAGHTVIEGRGIHSTAVYQSLIMNPDDDEAAAAAAAQLLGATAQWRPLPDLTIVITDDVHSAVGRAETRDAITYTAEQWQLHRRAAALFERLAAQDPEHVRLLDRREHDTDNLVAIISGWITTAPTRALSGVPARIVSG